MVAQTRSAPKVAMSPEISLVLVAYQSSAVAGGAITTFRREMSRLGLGCEVVVVDHSEDAAESARLQSIAPDRLLARPNRGYAAGVNAGVAASTGRVILVGNPDLVFQEGSVGAMMSALSDGWDIVGPQFMLAGLLFPPADLQTPSEEARRWLAGRFSVVWRRVFRREFARWRLVWDTSEPVATVALSGALLMFRREAFDLVGAWDEGYFLYYEETDWLRRATAASLRMAQVPRAKVEHAWGHAADPAGSQGHFASSRARFLSANFGWRGRVVQRLRFGASPLEPQPFPSKPGLLPGGRLWWLLSPTALGMPAAGLLGTSDDLFGALRGVAKARHSPVQGLVLAVEAPTAHIAGTWLLEASDG
jgi:GT2 family glycosyltransferase